MAVQETASQLSMALKVQEYPTLKVRERAVADGRRRDDHDPCRCQTHGPCRVVSGASDAFIRLFEAERLEAELTDREAS